MIKCVAYCRVSTSSKDQANSLENQLSYFKREISRRRGYNLLEIYADKGVSGTSLSRPQFDKMLYDAGLDIIEVRNADNDQRKKYKKYVLVPSSTRKPKFNLILVKNTSRFARNVLVEEILRELKGVGVHVYFLDLHKSTENDEDITFIQIFQTFDERSSRDKSKKVRFGQAEGAEKGVISANSKLYGYKYIQHENRLEIIPQEAEVIKLIFSLYSEGLGIRRILNQLNDKGIYTRAGKPFGKSTIRRILTNEKYAGINARLKYDKGTVFNKNSYAKVKPREEWATYQKSDKIPAIISEELFNQCQEKLISSVNHINQAGLYKGTTEFAGLIVCGKCGENYISNVDRGRRFYNCKTKKHHGTKECDNKNVSLQRLNEEITSDKYRKELFSYKIEYIEKLNELLQYLENQADSNDNTEVTALRQELKELKRKREKLLDLHLDNLIDKDLYKERLEPLEGKIKALENRIDKLSKPVSELSMDINKITGLYMTVLHMEIKDSYTKEEIISDIDRIIIDGEKITVV